MGETEKLEEVGYLQDIVSYIFDEKKIVSYKWISNTLAVHVNKAKQLLYTLIKHVPEERLKELKVLYLVGGILPDDKGCRMQVTSEEDLEKVKTQFKVITSQHIYSICLKNCLSDLHVLCSVDGVKDSEVVRHGAIKCPRGVSRSADELTSNRQGTYVAVEDEKQWPTAQPKQKQSSSENNEKKSSKTAGSISSMFSAQNAKAKPGNNADTKKEEEKEEAKTCSDKKPVDTKNSSKSGKAPANRLAAMFSAQSVKPKSVKKDTQEDKKSKVEEKVAVKNSPITEKETKSENKKTSDTMGIQEKSSKSKGSKSGSKKSKQKKRKASGSAEDKSKRRKRIVVMDDSDSSSEDDIFGSDEETSPSPVPVVDEEMEEAVETAKPKEPEPQQETVSNGHHTRKRKLVDKTFVDEDGYLVTKKAYEYVSGSESDHGEGKENDKTTDSKISKSTDSKISKSTDSKSNNKEPEQHTKETKGTQKSLKSSPQKKNSPPEKKKQATLMSFFKRN